MRRGCVGRCIEAWWAWFEPLCVGEFGLPPTALPGISPSRGEIDMGQPLGHLLRCEWVSASL
ncbi:hypothetical protein AGR8A_Cc40666 [Agrobacterium fabrum str. J-07]|nr:hypothetical protein AGR8A_Cc40666 [Agrobacterium fabrum str. J-07]